MKVLAAVVLVLLGFAAFSMTFLVAPLAVLTLFYIAVAVRTSRAERAPIAQSRPNWGTQVQVDADLTPQPPPRRTRIAVQPGSETSSAAGASAAASSES